MPKLTENVLIGGRVYLAGEEISEADAKNVRPEVFASSKESATSEAEGDQGTTPEGAGGDRTEDDSSESTDGAEEEQSEPAESEGDDEAKQVDEPAKPSGGRGKRTSTK